MSTPRRRADVALVEAGLFPSREQARAAILAGDVRVAGRPLTKAGEAVAADVAFEVARGPRFVSRGGLKLEKALDTFGLEVDGLRCVDVGASTGGFTDCLLQRGAAAVTAIDVGYGQLAWSLRTDPRVTVLERTNIRAVDPEAVDAPFDFAVVDVSFISLGVVLPPVLRLLSEDASVVALVKPQFEAGKARVGKRGVVKDPLVHADVLAAAGEAAQALGLTVRGLTFSPITGPEGNIEFWMWAARGGLPTSDTPEAVVGRAHEQLGGAGARPDRPQP
jgi:23S rRNA (cytidine1920-2'-O)/16S rRNA (cytidine1409-2'-O)-methyltransferase